MYGLSPYEECRKGLMNMAVNWACYVADVESQNQEWDKAQNIKQSEGLAMSKYINEMQEQATIARR